MTPDVQALPQPDLPLLPTAAEAINSSKDTCPAEETAYVIDHGRFGDEMKVLVCQPVDFKVFAQNLVNLHNLRHPDDLTSLPANENTLKS